MAWVSADADHEACYGVFDARGPGSVISAAVAALVVVALSFGKPVGLGFRNCCRRRCCCGASVAMDGRHGVIQCYRGTSCVGHT